ncbi:MAG TPA: hypothetical protein VF691_17820 [Cytophagaceae bacterium]
MRFLFLTLFVAASTFCTAQVVKVKKGDIFIDGALVGKMEKSGSMFKGRSFAIKTLDGSPVLTGTLRYVSSILEKNDQLFYYQSIQFPSKGVAVGMSIEENPNYGIDDYFVKYFVDNKVFEAGKLNDEAANRFIKAHPDTIPAAITETLTIEEKYLEDMATIAERDRTKPLELFSLKPDVKLFYNEKYSAENFQIFQDKVLIGFASFLTRGASTGPVKKLVFYNVNKTPIARLDLSALGGFRIYSRSAEFSNMAHKIETTGVFSSYDKLLQATRFLIAKQGI